MKATNVTFFWFLYPIFIKMTNLMKIQVSVLKYQQVPKIKVLVLDSFWKKWSVHPYYKLNSLLYTEFLY